MSKCSAVRRSAQEIHRNNIKGPGGLLLLSGHQKALWRRWHLTPCFVFQGGDKAKNSTLQAGVAGAKREPGAGEI